ncbi:MAG: 50S ribosomal protein L22P [Candidatus Methanofastidiosum methylothiophilum]|jgi:large subunit ribosomal protein L22|uniref:Large ribosomal subunit protein uL22 n=1 Tax=Candidatus Methanofastidiosum methylothiophilum TaxID=1705564 RepID=A0A150IYM1_9EURY|nr:MAG: 50S ribosomal protein L22P [Candidatus Methanofastidiosum methylthiophilus]NMC77058.1 50S ribosomal protein L22 [Candidatus Methanofastidiosa archaeon]
MPYSLTQIDETKTAKVYGKNINISPKHSREICNTIKGMKIERAKELLEATVKIEKPIPFKRHYKKVGHKKGLSKWFAGRYPVKASKSILKLLNEVEANAEYKGLNSSRLKIIHASAYKGRVIPGFMPRAFGRASPYNHELTNVEIIVEER